MDPIRFPNTRLLLAAIFWTAWALSAHAAESGPANGAKDGIPALVRQLDDADFEKRDAAQKALLDRGVPALEALEAARKASESPEARARLDGVIAELRRQKRYAETKPGAEAGGLRATLRSDKEHYAAGEAIKLEWSLENAGKDARVHTPLGTLDVDLPGGGGRYSSSTGMLVVRRVDGKEAKGGTEIGCGMGPPEPSVGLEAGKASKTPIELDEIVGALEAGAYDMHVVYYAKTKSMVKGGKADVESNVLRIVIDPQAARP